jgi:hypothetical protein
MRSITSVRIATVALLAVLTSLLLSGATSASIPSGTPGVNIIAQNGFGDHNNSWAWSMDWFKGKLYVGTGRDELCLEGATLQYYYPLLDEYVLNPGPNVHCPTNEYDLDLRAEIWQYAPKTDTWKMVYRAPTIRNPNDPSLPVARDVAYRDMIVLKNSKGQQALFADAVTPDEYIPKLRRTHPPVLMRSFDGVHWQVVHMPAVMVHFPTGNFRPMGYRSMVEYRKHLYITVTPDLTGDGALFEVSNPFSNHPRLVQVSPRKLDIFEVEPFDGALYVGTGNAKTGYGVYRTYAKDGRMSKFYSVMTGGAGRGKVITSVVSMHVFQNRLYVGASGWYNQNVLPSSEMIAITPNEKWTLVVGDPRKLKNGFTIYPTSGLYDGFFNIFNAHFWRMATSAGGMYVGTNDWSILLQLDKNLGDLQSLLTGELGFDIWGTCDGTDWYAVTRDAFSGDGFNFGGRTLQPGGPGGDTLYVGSANQAQGTSIFQDNDPLCSSGMNTSGSVAAPTALMTNARPKGTLLTWQPVAHATSYQVLESSFTPVTLSFTAPPALPNGFRFEDASPIPTNPGTPGAHQVQINLPGNFLPTGTTTSTYFVDRSRGHHAYEVVAKTATGEFSTPSNVEVVPDPRPAATFGAIRQALGEPSAVAAGVGSPAPPSARQVKLLNAAESAWRAGHRATALADLKRLQAAAGYNTDLALTASRLARNLQYANVAGGL